MVVCYKFPELRQVNKSISTLTIINIQKIIKKQNTKN
jgi:hypothetical protein